MNYEILREISEAFYKNITTIESNIKEQDQNIYSSFRMAAEELLKVINKIDKYEKEGIGFFNRILNNEDFKSDMLIKYKIDRKMFNALEKIRKNGNDVTHNLLKFFDENDTKEIYFRILVLAQKVLVNERGINTFNITKTQIDKEVENIIKNGNKKETVKISKEEFAKEITELEKRINEFSEGNDINTTLAASYLKKMSGIIIEQILDTNIKYNEIEDLKIGEFSGLYKTYYKMSELEQTNSSEDMIAIIIDNKFVIRNILKQKYNISVFNELVKPNEELEDQDSLDNNAQIANAIEKVVAQQEATYDINGAVYYVEKQKRFIAQENEYYLVELKKAIADNSKGKTVYSKVKLPSNYSLEISLKKEEINILGNPTPIFIISNYRIAIRPCEIEKIIKVVTGKKVKVSKKSNFYNTLMNYLQINKCTLLDILEFKEDKYLEFKNEFNKISASILEDFMEAMDLTRKIIKENEFESGVNIIRYFLTRLKNDVLKHQMSEEPSTISKSNVYLNRKAFRFERNPFTFELSKHTAESGYLFEALNIADFQDDIAVRKIKEQMKEKQTSFIKIEDKKIEEHINKYNDRIKTNYNQDCGIIGIINGYAYEEKNTKDLRNLIEYLKNLSETNEKTEYKKLKDEFLKNNKLDSEEKINVLEKAFNHSNIAVILGEAGSGKTELLCNYFTKIFMDKKILFISNTHTSKQNMKKRVEKNIGIRENYSFKTVKSLINSRLQYVNYDIIIVDEAKVISNKEMCKLIKILNNRFEYMILGGDLGQVDAINLGNWFEILSQTIDEKNVFPLKNNHRTNLKEIKEVWDKVRRRDEDTLEYLINNNYIEKINTSIFNKQDDDEIILCLNYGGFYGITNINSYFQSDNSNQEFKNNLEIYKVGDPVVFNQNANELNKYNDYLYNNLKGVIRNIEEDEVYITFIVHVDTYIPKDESIVRVSSKEEDWSDVIIKIKKYTDHPDDNDEEEYLCPFDVTYALSIHKAQGLEYNSIKVVITPESEELINNEIFYTAITRTKSKLKIYTTTNNTEKLKEILSKKEEKMDSNLLFQI